MFNLFPRLSKNSETDNQFYTGQTISFDQLTTLVQTSSTVVESARNAGKGSDLYDAVKRTAIPVIFGNAYTAKNTRSTKASFKSNGHIYLDFDFDSSTDAVVFKETIINKPFVKACWISLSGKGLSVLVKVNPKNCNKYQFDQYWDKLNEIFQDKLDKRTRDFYRLVCIPHDANVYINRDAVVFDSLYPVDYTDGLRYSTPLEFESLTKPLIFPEGKDVLQLDFYKYRYNKVSIGKRTSTVGAICMQLIYLNPDAHRSLVLSALLSFNQNYCIKPLSHLEVDNILSSNWKKRNTFDITKYLKRRYVFFHPACKIPLHERQRIRGQEMRKLKRTIVFNAVDNLMQVVKPSNISTDVIAEYTGIKKVTVYKYLTNDLKNKIEKYNRSSKNDTFYIDLIYSTSANNMSQIEKVSPDHTPTEYKIYGALEDLQDNINRITQQLVADYTGLSIATVKRNWLPAFKELVRDYNINVKSYSLE